MTFDKVECLAEVSHLRPAESNYGVERGFDCPSSVQSQCCESGLAADLLARSISPDKYHSPPMAINH